MFEKLDQGQFEHIIDMLILYKQMNPKKTVLINEKSVREAFEFIQTHGSDFASQLGMAKN